MQYKDCQTLMYKIYLALQNWEIEKPSDFENYKAYQLDYQSCPNNVSICHTSKMQFQ